MGISGDTRVVGIIGDPVAHSSSPAMHNAAFRALGLDFAYVAFRVRPAQLAAAIAGLRALDIVGVNVTVPHKERVVPLLDSVSATARRIGAVNTVVNRGGHLHGENTDVVGFARALHAAGFRPRQARTLVIGAGGAARAVVAALAASGARAIIVANRNAARAQSLAETFRSRAMRIVVGDLAALGDQALLASVDAVVNATSIGLHGERFPPMAYQATRDGCLFVDVVYGRKTDFLVRAARARRPTADGSAMLLHQGAAAFTLWTGRRAPLAAMRAALGLRAQSGKKIDKGPSAE